MRVGLKGHPSPSRSPYSVKRYYPVPGLECPLNDDSTTEDEQLSLGTSELNDMRFRRGNAVKSDSCHRHPTVSTAKLARRVPLTCGSFAPSPPSS